MRLALLGDSVAWGQGASRSDERLGPRLERALRGRVIGANDLTHREPVEDAVRSLAEAVLPAVAEAAEVRGWVRDQ